MAGVSPVAERLKGKLLKKNQDIIITHYAKTSEQNSSIQYVIYKILVQLKVRALSKEINEIDLKVELTEQKLKKYFGYWLDVCSSYLEFLRYF